MKIVKNPPPSSWEQLTKRPALDTAFLEGTINNILSRVRNGGDQAVIQFTKQFDKVEISNLEIPLETIKSAGDQLDDELKPAIQTAAANIRKFHAAQANGLLDMETSPGVQCWRRSVPIEKVGIYIPGGTAPLFSTVLMLAIPANEAGCKEIILCSPPGTDGHIHPAILYAANITGVTRVFRVGGAQAIAAMAYGTESVPKVYKIFGPGNQYVTAAKQKVSQEGIAIDMPAGPSEVAVLADETARPDFIAADLLSQAEHGPDSQVVLVTTSETIASETASELRKQLSRLPRVQVAIKALENSLAVVVPDLETGVDFINAYAPEHLIIACKDDEIVSERIINSGSVFLGNYTPESAGDYASGTNHTLPTNGAARAYSGVSLESFQKKITYQKISAEGLVNLGPVVETMAAAELLEAHKNAVTIRLNAIKSTIS